MSALSSLNGKTHNDSRFNQDLRKKFPTNRESARWNLSGELWFHAVEHFGRRRAANRITPASRLNATASPAREKTVENSPRTIQIQFQVWMAPCFHKFSLGNGQLLRQSGWVAPLCLLFWSPLLWSCFPQSVDGERSQGPLHSLPKTLPEILAGFFFGHKGLYRNSRATLTVICPPFCFGYTLQTECLTG